MSISEAMDKKDMYCMYWREHLPLLVYQCHHRNIDNIIKSILCTFECLFGLYNKPSPSSFMIMCIWESL